MNRDTSAVAGFFEDLPVLMFVLTGTMTLVMSSVFLSDALSKDTREIRLDDLAERVADAVLFEISEGSSGELATTSSLRSGQYALCIDELTDGRNHSLSVKIVHPLRDSLFQESDDTLEPPRGSSSASRLINAITDTGCVGIVVIQVAVW